MRALRRKPRRCPPPAEDDAGERLSADHAALRPRSAAAPSPNVLSIFCAAAPLAAAAMPPIAEPPVSLPSCAAVEAAVPIEVPARIAPSVAPPTAPAAPTAAPPASIGTAAATDGRAERRTRAELGRPGDQPGGNAGAEDAEPEQREGAEREAHRASEVGLLPLHRRDELGEEVGADADDDLRHRQRTSKISRRVGLGASGRYRIAKHTAQHAAHSARALVAARRLDRAEHDKHFLRGDLRDRAITEFGIRLVEQPADLGERDLRHVLALILREPLLGHNLKAVFLGDPFAGGCQLLLVRGVEPRGDHPPRVIALRAGIGESDLRPGAERQRALLAEMGIVEAPELPAVRLDQKIESRAVGELVIAVGRFGVGDRRGEQFSHGIGPSHKGPPIPCRDTMFVPDWCRISPDLTGRS